MTGRTMMREALKELRIFARNSPGETLGYVLLMFVLASNDLIEVIPQLDFVTRDSSFPYFHESHDIVAIGIALTLAYKRGIGLGFLAIAIFYSAHLPYFAMSFPTELYEDLKITIAAIMGVLGVTIIGRLREAIALANIREKQAKEAQHDRDESENRYRGMLGSMSEVILIVDAWGSCLEMPQTRPRMPVAQYFSAWVGHKLEEVLDAFVASDLTKLSRQALEEGRAVGSHLASVGGRSICFDIVMSPIGEGRVMWVMREGINSETKSAAADARSGKELSVD